MFFFKNSVIAYDFSYVLKLMGHPMYLYLLSQLLHRLPVPLTAGLQRFLVVVPPHCSKILPSCIMKPSRNSVVTDFTSGLARCLSRNHHLPRLYL